MLAFYTLIHVLLHGASFDTKQPMHTEAFTRILLRRGGSYTECIYTEVTQIFVQGSVSGTGLFTERCFYTRVLLD